MTGQILTIGKGRIMRKSEGNGLGTNVLKITDGTNYERGLPMKDQVCILSFDMHLQNLLVAAEEDKTLDLMLGVTVEDARFIKPPDIKLARELASQHLSMVIAEEGLIGGFKDHVLHFLALNGVLYDRNVKVRPMAMIVKMM